MIATGKSITAIVLGFSKPLAANRAQNLANYGYFVYSAGANGDFRRRRRELCHAELGGLHRGRR